MLSVHRGRAVCAAVKAILAVASCSAASLAMAADEPKATELDEVIVTGFRGSLEAALQVKQEEVGAVDAIMAEDIADFPDLNLAESIQRIPGVSIARDAGEGRRITVRGLSPEFTRIRINGMEAMSANGGTDAAGGTNRGRSFDFNTFASELFNSITVRKTASASVEEGSLGATVDLRTARPFDYKGLTLVGSANAAYNSLSEDTDPRAAFLISDTFAEDTFGVLFSAAYTQRHLIDEGSSTVRWQSLGTVGTAPGYSGPAVNTAFVPRIPRYDYYKHDQDRLGLTGSLQWRPSDSAEINLDALYAKFDATRHEIFLEVPNFSSGASGMQVADAVLGQPDYNGNQSVVYGVFNNVDIRSEHRYDELSTVFKQFTLDGTLRLTDTLKLYGQAGYSSADHNNPIQTTLLFDWNNSSSYTFDYRGNDRLPYVSFGSTNLTSTVNGTPQTATASTVDSGGWYLSQVRLRPQTAFNAFTNYLANLEWEMSDAMKVEGGVQLKKFEFKTTERRRSNGTASNQEGVIPAGLSTIPIASYATTFTYPSSIGLPSGSAGTFLLPNYDAAVGVLGIYNQSVFPMGIETALGGNNNSRVTETDKGAYAQFDMEADIGSMRLRGNVGVRYVRTEQEAQGYSFLSGAAVAATADRTYSDTLPSLNLALNVTPEFVLRFGVAKVMSRPALGSLPPGGAVNVSGNNRNATLGNPNTDPTRATAYDLSAEWYFADESLLSLALFRKAIDSRPQSLTLTNQVFTGNPFGIPDSVAVAACGTLPNCAPDLPIWTFNTTINGPGGSLKGLEFGYQQPFSFLPGALKNFGVIMNFTAVDSTVTYVDPSSGAFNDDLTGLSKTAYNATIYYETDKFSARVSAAYRDGYLDQAPGRNSNHLEGTESTTTVDASLKYTINDHFEVTLEGLNLTDEYQDQWVDETARRLSYYHHTGRNYILGVRAKL